MCDNPIILCKLCRYRDFRDPDGNHTMFYWKLLTVRLAFVIVFEVSFLSRLCRLKNEWSCEIYQEIIVCNYYGRSAVGKALRITIQGLRADGELLAFLIRCQILCIFTMHKHYIFFVRSDILNI